MNIKLILLFVIFVVVLVFGFLIKGERFKMRQVATGKTIHVKRGFSFTYLFFGPFVPLFRGHIGGFFLTLFVTLCSCGTGHLILLFCYNGMYINWLVKRGYVREDVLPVHVNLSASYEPIEVDPQQAEEERIRREQALEERNRKIAEVQENIKEKAQVAQAAAAVGWRSGKVKFKEISSVGKIKFKEVSSVGKEKLIKISRAVKEKLVESAGTFSDWVNRLSPQVKRRFMVGLGLLFLFILFISLYLDPRLHLQIHKWKYGMTPEQSEEYQEKILLVQEENQEFVRVLDEKKEQKNRLEEEVKLYQSAYEKYNPDKVLKETLASVYQQSTASAIECKAIILESFGLDTGIKHYREDDGTGEGQDVQEYVVDQAVGQLASGTAGDVLKDSINSGIDSWSEDPSLSGALEGLAEGFESGVAAAISDAPKKMAAAFLGDSIVNAVEAAASFRDLDTTSEHLLNSIAGEMKSSSEKFKTCLDNETMTKEELYKMIYWYYQYAESASAMDHYSDGKSQTEIFGKSYHTPLLKKYETFVGNGALLRLLGTEENDEKR